MGQQVSKDVRSRLEHCTLEELLNEDKFIEELQRHLPGLAKRSNIKLAKVLASWETLCKDSSSGSRPNLPSKGVNSSLKDRNSRTYKISSLWSINSEDIGIPKNVAEVLKQNHHNLLRRSKNGVDLQSPADHYEYTCTVETGRTLDRILWRYLTTFYYDLISELDDTKQRSRTENGGVAFAVAVICQSGKHDPDTVRERVMGWVKVGRRYRGFMNALCSGCLFLFPEKISDLVWEEYVPVKGDTFTKVIQFLQTHSIVRKCEEEGWNDVSDKILQTLRGPFRSLISFQFQPGQQSQIGWDIHSHEQSMHGREEVEETQDTDIDNPPLRRIFDSRALPKLATNGIIKTKLPGAARVRRKKGTSCARRQLQSFAKGLAAHQTPRPEKSYLRQRKDPESGSPRTPTQCRTSTPNDLGQWHFATNHQEGQAFINDGSRDPLRDISSNVMNVYPSGTDSVQTMQEVDSSPNSHPRFVSPTSRQVHVDQRHWTGESISDILRLERTGISSISALLNHESNTSSAAPTTTQDSCQGPETALVLDSVIVPQESGAIPAGVTTTFLRAIQFEKDILQRIVLERPTDILGGIWFGGPQGYPPCVSLRLSRTLGDIVKPSGRQVYVGGPSPAAISTAAGIFMIELGYFKQMIQRDGFGEIFWNECGEEAFVTMQVIDSELVADFIRGVD